MCLAQISICFVVILLCRFLLKKWRWGIPAGETCSVSQSHLTCDSGSSNEGVNCVVAVMTFTTAFPSITLRTSIVRNLVLKEKSLRKRLCVVEDMLSWVDVDPGWNPEDNFRILDEPMSESDLGGIAGSVLTAPISFERPCWEMTIIGNLKSISGEPISAVLFKYHHALADGSTMLAKLLARATCLDASQSITSLLPAPRIVREHSREMKLISIFQSLFSLLSMRPDSPGLFRARTLRAPGAKINVSLSSGMMTVAEAKRIAENCGKEYSVNDVLTAVFARAFRHFQLKRSPSVQDIKSVVWVSVKKPRKEDWGNSGLAFGYCQLALSAVDPLECLKQSHNRLCRLKTSADAVVINRALNVIGKVPVWFGKIIARNTANMASVSMSNLAGPMAPVVWPVDAGEPATSSCAGEIKSIHFVTSPPFQFGPLVSVISYNGKFFMSVSAREDLLSQSDLDEIMFSCVPFAVQEFSSSLLQQ